jgi:TorA maturation chaperone TorD
MKRSKMMTTNPDSPLIPEITEERGAELAQTQNTASAIDQAVMDAEEVFRDLGRLDATLFYSTVADSMLVQIFQRIKKSKAYKNIPIRDESGNIRPSKNLEEFCRVKLGKSYTRLFELSQNLRTLGPDLYESAERIGFRAKDYRALKALPAEEQAVVKQAIESESKDEVLGILQDMAARHQAEREAAKKEKDDLAADLEARGKLLEVKAERLERTEEELYKLKSLPPDADLELKLAREEEAVERLHKEHVTFLVASKTFLQAVSETLGDGDVSAHTKEYAVFEVRQVAESFNQYLLDCSIPVDFEDIVYPEWSRQQAGADIEAGHTEEPNGAHGSW